MGVIVYLIGGGIDDWEVPGSRLAICTYWSRSAPNQELGTRNYFLFL